MPPIITPMPVPFTILIDAREKAPYTFDGLHADAKDNRRPLSILRQSVFLQTGDYSIAGMEKLVTVERKSLEDLYSTLGQHRNRFEAEYRRMSRMAYAAVVVEADWDTIMFRPPPRSRLLPKTVHRTMIAWGIRYGVPCVPMGSRRAAEITTFQILEKFWREYHEDECEGSQKRVGRRSGKTRDGNSSGGNIGDGSSDRRVEQPATS